MTLPRITPAIPDAEGDAEKGDARGLYGFGRPAHGADPSATYRFQPVDMKSTVQEHIEDIAKEFGDEVDTGQASESSTAASSAATD